MRTPISSIVLIGICQTGLLAVELPAGPHWTDFGVVSVKKADGSDTAGLGEEIVVEVANIQMWQVFNEKKSEELILSIDGVRIPGLTPLNPTVSESISYMGAAPNSS